MSDGENSRLRTSSGKDASFSTRPDKRWAMVIFVSAELASSAAASWARKNQIVPLCE